MIAEYPVNELGPVDGAVIHVDRPTASEVLVIFVPALIS